MLIIGEKLNGTLKKTAAAINSRDAAYVQDLARRQAEAGADYLDVNAGTGVGNEVDDLAWLVETVQAAVDLPLCLDSADPAALQAGMGCVKRVPMVNSISGESSRLDGILPLVAQHTSPVIALLLDDKGIPPDSQGRMRVARYILERTRQEGVPDEKVYIDPLAMTIATQTDSALIALETMRALRSEYPQAKFSIGLSKLLAAGLDAAIMNPLEQSLMNMLYATELILGRDRYCKRYTSAFRAGKIKLEAQA
jgi:5-methyltetrahydrofolate--homocysteine methyltransferase